MAVGLVAIATITMPFVVGGTTAEAQESDTTVTTEAAAAPVAPDTDTSERPPEEIPPPPAGSTEPPAESAPAPTTEPAAEAEEEADEEEESSPEAEEPDVEVTAELGRGVEISAGDAFSLQLRARVQVQAALAHATQTAIDAGADEHWALDFQIRRMRLVFAGHALTRDLRYYIQLGFSPRDMERDLLVPVRDAYLNWQAHRDIGVRFGQMKVPYGLQRVVSSSALQFVDRSSVVAELNLDRDIGVTLISEDFLGLNGLLQYQAGLFGGRGRNRFGGLDSALVAGMVRVNPFGSFDHLSEGDISRSMQPRLSIGASAAYNIDSNRARSTHENVLQVARFDYLHLDADVHFKWAGFSFLSEIMYREANQPSATGTVDGEDVTEYSRSAWGWFAQAGYVLPPIPIEFAARYGETRPLDQNDPAAEFFLLRELGGAVSYYIAQHALKVQLDYFYYFGDDPRAERHQVRLQAQLYF
ncbi:Hypothetical protein DB32_008333 [Sandaracinus amylolyticus]|uniref:Phosphate-selective porin O and P n=2 Tax=Sandaracinus amylolyticus TaxID=927083 RepID=A0A0F6SHX1_9BACT|nr:Hypothetical protein DB32_008333 [Sandaracinus amylolyticus]